MVHTPPGGEGRGAAAADAGLMSIGAVLGALRPEFPDITISKIRFLESEGLVEPRRTPAGYRKFSERDVERLGRVLRMQRDHYLPLRVIREQLDTGEPPEVVASAAADGGRSHGSPRAPEPPVTTPAPVGRAELLAETGTAERQLVEWESYGLITPLPDGTYDGGSLAVAALVGELGRFGIEPRHLRVMKAAADREAGLVDQVVAPLRRHRNPQTRAHAEARTREIAGLAVRLHAALVQSALGVRLP
ncbi:MerR family transcriptional regulator [Streptomyces sp. ZYX-F-203]